MPSDVKQQSFRGDGARSGGVVPSQCRQSGFMRALNCVSSQDEDDAKSLCTRYSGGAAEGKQQFEEEQKRIFPVGCFSTAASNWKPRHLQISGFY